MYESPAHQYALDIQSGKTQANRYVKLAVERYLEDLEHAHERGIVFDEDAAWHAIDFFQFIRHWKGSFAGKPFELSPFQHFIIWNLFGWVYEDTDLRRFQTAYIEIPRKNGKTGLAAGIALYMLYADGEFGAEVYSAATKKDQAKLSFTDAKKYIQKSPALKSRANVLTNNISIPKLDSKFEPLGADSDTMDGLNVHCAIIDELHAHKDAGVVDIISTATGARDQPLIFEITTAGRDTNSICFHHRDYTIAVLERKEGFEDDSWFGMIFTLDHPDDWKDPEKWVMANPNLGISLKQSYMEKECKKALVMKSYENTFKRLHLGIWTSDGETWISDEKWKARRSQHDLLEYLKGRKCFGGLDLAKVQDINAYSLFFPNEDNKSGFLLMFFFVPEETVKQAIENKMTPYNRWVEQGYLIETPGNVRDDDFIIDFILDSTKAYDVQSIAYDPWEATNIVAKLQEEGVETSEFRQGFKTMSQPTKTFEKMIVGGMIEHCGNGVMRWMMGNVVIVSDPAENIKIDKKKSGKKVDGAVAAVMSLGEWMTFHPPLSNPYNDRGVVSV
ncbi:terminase TerL endonuclease subunit [Rapidithrix thailandica]|uniref:Terminase TerL endonuclease subunit n=1 Tax=Rapidithrix thailandica TaxID=413964 RepID=A0AAW9SF15_9BACT